MAGENVRLSKRTLSILMLGSICILALIFLYGLQVVPRYITFDMPPAPDSYPLVGWSSATQSVWTDLAIPSAPSRAFLWRRDAGLGYESGSRVPSWEDLLAYFDKRLSIEGWSKTDSSIPCSLYLPEAAFLKYGAQGYVTYQRTREMGLPEEIPTGDVVCLAIWNNEGHPDVFRVVLLTVKKSLFTGLNRIFGD